MRAYEITPRHTQLVINESLLNEESFWVTISRLISKGGPEAKAAINAGEDVLKSAKAAEQGASGVTQGLKNVGSAVKDFSIGGAVGWTATQLNDLVNWVKKIAPDIWKHVEDGTIPLALVIGALVLYGGVKLIDKYTAPDAQHTPAPSA